MLTIFKKTKKFRGCILMSYRMFRMVKNLTSLVREDISCHFSFWSIRSKEVMAGVSDRDIE